MAANSQGKAMRRLRNHMHGKIVIVEIGPERTKYSIHASLLAEHSEYFKKALNGPWKEAKEGVVILKDVDCNAFDIFVEWLYTQKLPYLRTGWLPQQNMSDEWEEQIDILKIKVWPSLG